MVGANAVWHYMAKKNRAKEMAHPNIEPLCNKESLRLLGVEALGYMTEKEEEVTCLACVMIKRRCDSYKRYRENHPEKVKETATAYRQSEKGKQKHNELQRGYLSRLNPEAKKEYYQKAHKQISRNLTDTYIKRLIVRDSGLRLKDIPQEMVEIKRASVILQRLIKEQK